MSKLDIPFVQLNADSAFDSIDAKLSNLQHHQLEHLLWSNDGYKPGVSFNIAHNGECIFLKFKVEEDNIRAVHTQANAPVYTDSCVEFFISLGGDNYYNLEFNCIGTCTIGYGDNKLNRDLLPVKVIDTIRSQTKIRRVYQHFVYEWELLLVIPVTVFIHNSDINLSSKTCRVNFYKCGDELPRPHFIAWNNIAWPEPNFHLSQFFEKALFLAQ